ncbi:MAG: sulfatase [Spirochaetales bacterium]|nr:sulfatase [Spirochaetales bacterium]
MKAIVILSDTINRRYLSMYGNTRVRTPNLERLSERSHIFDAHWTGSAPCMPARRDLMTGRLGFLERNWGPIEAFDRTLPEVLHANGVRSHIVTDHYHYAELGGEGYCQSFSTWQMHRGQEKDTIEWPAAGYRTPEHKGRMNEFYQWNRRSFVREDRYPSPMTYKSGAEWLERHGKEDDFLLWIEGFDPHEPFDVPERYLEMYGDTYDGEVFEWPAYAPFDGTDEELLHIRNRYAATLTMTDHWIGRVLDVCDRLNLWDDTMIIFTTDHGFMLGEHGLMGKNYMQAYNEIYHIPMLVHQPGQTTTARVDALTQNIDLFPTLCEHFGVDETTIANPLHGQSLLPLVRGEVDHLREGVLYGVYGKSVNLTDGRYTYLKAPVCEENSPLYLYTSMPTTLRQYIGISSINDIGSLEMGPFLSWTDFPVYRIPAATFEYDDATQTFAQRGEYHGTDYLFDIRSDYTQERAVEEPEVSVRMRTLLVELLRTHDAPEEQFIRLGLPPAEPGST